MSVLALLAGQTPPAPPEPKSGLLRDALLPTLPRYATFTMTPETADDVLASIVATKAAIHKSVPQRGRVIEVVMAPGVYTTPVLDQGWVLQRSSTGNPDDVVVEVDQTRGGVVHVFGSTTWYRGITLRSVAHPTGGIGPKYPLHVTGGGTVTLIDCNLEALNPGSDGGPACMGLDGGDNLRLSFVGCRFTNLGGVIANIHGGGIGPEGQDIAFYDCTVINPASETTIGYSGPIEERADLYFIGGNVTAGLMEGGAVAHTTGWPAPVGGFSNYERVAFGLDRF